MYWFNKKEFQYPLSMYRHIKLDKLIERKENEVPEGFVILTREI